jgi:ribosome-associated toxin RatA of RatAB toxin-antitoxin module
MIASEVRHARHGAEIAAPAEFLYGLVAEAPAAPWVFPATVHVEFLDRDPAEERLRIWAADGDNVRSWTSHRRLDRAGRRVAFQQEEPAAPIAFMRGEWLVEPLAEARSRVSLTHDFSAAGDDPAALAGIESMVDRISAGQLAAMERFAALGAGRGGRGPLSFTETAELPCPVETAYAFVHDFAAWADLLPEVERASVRDAGHGLLLVDQTRREGGGRTRTTRSAHVCFPGSHIAFKEMTPPALVAAHTGSWRFDKSEGGCRVVVRHVVAPRYAALAERLGGDPTDEAATGYLRRVIGAPTRAVLSRLAGLS